MFRYTNHVCKKCFLQNDPFHKVTLNEDGVCSLCAKPAPEEARRDWDALEKRFAAHKSGCGAKYTRSHPPVAIVYREMCADKGAALRREAAIKKLPRAEKLKLAEGTDDA